MPQQYGDIDPSTGLNYSAGVVTSIPYDAMNPDTHQPIVVDRPVSRGDDGRELQPHHIAKLGDFHQYPMFDSVTPDGQRYTNVRRGDSGGGGVGSGGGGGGQYGHDNNHAPNYAQTTMSSRNGRRADNNNTSYYPSNSTISSSNTRSSDQLSVYSTISSAARSSMLSVAPSTADMMPPPMATIDGGMIPADSVVETMFYDLMLKRGYMNLPEVAKKQMMAYPTSKKWIMVNQDMLADRQAEQKRRQATVQGGRDPDEDSPEWYVKKIMDGTITAKQLGSLSVSLRTQPIG